ncbi:MAG: class I SAM-dependent methyltransferase [Thermoproteota archaeon]|nr:class I SAM-dependent methyltransferase [Thermoproteota archaeon]
MSDPFGKGLMAYYRGNKPVYRSRRDDGYVQEGSFEAYFSEYKDWAECERKTLKYVQGKVLEIGCGAGRHSLWLQRKGFEVAAVDISRLAVKVAKLRGVKDCLITSALELPFTVCSFDTVLLLGNNFGVAGDVETTKKMLKELHNIATENGRLIASCRDPYKTNNPVHLKYHELNRKRGRPAGQITFRVEYKEQVGGWFNLLIVSPEEMAEICKPAGWKIKKLFKQNGFYAVVVVKS